MKRYISIILILMAALGCAACGAAQEAKGGKSIVTLDINPSIELSVDSNNVVTGVYCSNEDARILLSEDAELKGKDAADAAEKITSMAIDLGYINDENKIVGTAVVSTVAPSGKKLEKKIRAAVENTAESKGISVSTTDGFFFSFTRKYDKFRAEHPNTDISPAKFKLALSAADTGSITLEAAAVTDEEKLIDMITKHHEKAEVYVTNAFERVRASSDLAYEKAVGLVEDGIYMKHYAKHILKHKDNFFYGAMYMTYKSAYRGISAMARMSDAIDKLYDTELTEEQINKVAKALDLKEDELPLIQNADGTVTVRSVESYVDRLLKNMEDEEKAAELTKELTLTLNGIETEINVTINGKLEDNRRKTADIIRESRKILTEISKLIPDSAKEAYDACLADFDEITGKIEELKDDGKLTGDDYRAVAELLAPKIAALREKIDKDLSEEELGKIDAERERTRATLEKYKAEYDEKVNEAENRAKSYLEKARQKRVEEGRNRRA